MSRSQACLDYAMAKIEHNEIMNVFVKPNEPYQVYLSMVMARKRALKKNTAVLNYGVNKTSSEA